ncbi:MAG: acyl carrier protein [Ilumatobacter sp.]|nr:acyl carrier protein [Ilumatobacter sp.]
MTISESQLLQFINDEVRLSHAVEVERDTDLLLTGLVDSVGVIEIVGWIEDEHGVEIDPLDIVLDNFQTVGRMLAYVDRLSPESTKG